MNVDVIILSWDRTEDTKLAINSALNQIGVNINIYIVDQGSKKECLVEIENICSLHDNITLIKNIKNTGVTGGRNQASFPGKGKYIVALDNDAEFETNNELRKMYDLFEQKINIAVLAFKINRFGSNDIDESSWSYGKESAEWSGSNFLTTRFVGAGHAIRRDLFETINGYDEALFFLHEEVDLSRRFINLGYEIEYRSDISIGHKVSKEHRVSWSGGRWEFHARNKTYLSLKFSTPILNFIFHSLLLIIEGFKKKMFIKTIFGIKNGVFLFFKNKSTFKVEECVFNETSEKYYRKFTPGAEGSWNKRVIRRIREIIK